MKQHTKVYMPDWFCPICQFKIFGSKDTCFKCGTTRSSTLLSTTPNLEERKYKESIQEVSEQIFELKDKLTDGEFKTILDGLQSCYKVAPADEKVLAQNQCIENGVMVIGGDGRWLCPQCNFVLFPDKKECKKCHIKRPY